ncbi:zinc-binding dehydrogenase [Candidatus Entotheonella palauensis]|uniref:Alcohol dehydrogenase n=1 Tax=Candidatus Entotheonella gemina TaxID=1429439 RepID=W4LZN8_9BACT|nr:zinc-binding dehydrogenase [Candidatus Entotheonella palauensis]ETX03358.1 MAG: alcohol dehydrogenase [Candidatus Entotheonella gemina]
MKAAVLSEIGGHLTIENIPTPQPKAGEVLVKVTSCGVCHTDLHVVKGEVAFPMPCVLGHEIAGVVAEVAPDVTHIQPGQEVVCSFIMPCGACGYCAQGRDDLCETFFAMNRLNGTLYDGTSRLRRSDGTSLAMYSMGGLAEYAVVTATDVFPAPSNVPLADCCILGCAMMTAYGAVKNQARIQPRDRVAVVGVGGIGSNVIQVARAFGAGQIIAVDIRDDKLEAARGLGATHTVNAAQDDVVAAVNAVTDGRGVDVAIEALGRPETVLNAFNITSDGGRMVVIGIAPGTTTAPIEITRLVRRGIHLMGSYGSRVRTDLPEVLSLAARDQVSVSQPITRRYRLNEADDAYAALNRGEIVGRAIVIMD